MLALLRPMIRTLLGEPRVRLALPFRVFSEANERASRIVVAQRAKAQRQETYIRLMGIAVHPRIANPGYTLPLVVRFVLTNDWHMDEDNLKIAFKHVQDAVSDWLGVDDASPHVLWLCDQEQTHDKKRWGSLVEIWPFNLQVTVERTEAGAPVAYRIARAASIDHG